MALIPDNRPPTPTRPTKKALFKGIMVAVILHLIFVLAYLYASGNLGDRHNPAAPETASVPLEPKSTIAVAAPREIVPLMAVATPAPLEPKSTIAAAIPPKKAPETADAAYADQWSDADGGKHDAHSDPPPEARDVEKPVEIQANAPDRPAAVDSAKGAPAIVAAKAAKPALPPIAAPPSPKIPDAWVAREKARLEKELVYYEEVYRRREKAVVSVEEKEDLLRPINETKAKLQKLQASPEEYFGLMKKY